MTPTENDSQQRAEKESHDKYQNDMLMLMLISKQMLMRTHAGTHGHTFFVAVSTSIFRFRCVCVFIS